MTFQWLEDLELGEPVYDSLAMQRTIQRGETNHRLGRVHSVLFIRTRKTRYGVAI